MPGKHGKLLAALLAGACLRCGGPSVDPTGPAARTANEPAKTPSPDATVGSWTNGKVTRAEVDREGARLPPLLKTQFQSPGGRKELAMSLIDKRLLVEEAGRRGLQKSPEIARQVKDFEDRLAVQALMQAEERSTPPPGEPEQRAWFDAHKAELATPERVRLVKATVAIKPSATAAERAKAKARADELLRKAKAGAPFDQLAREGDGPGGDLGLVTRGDLHDPDLEKAAFALAEGAVAGPIAGKDGLSIVKLVERKPARVPSFEEARAEVRARLEPMHKRKAFDDLRERLRKEGNVKLDEGALR